MRYLLFFFISVLAINCVSAETGRVISVIDGNTLVVNVEGEELKIILLGIDCPELAQSFGEEAKKQLEKIVLSKEVRFTIIGKDRKGNRLAEVFMVKNGADPRIELLKQGLAWASQSSPVEEFVKLQTAAKEKAKGLWRDETPTPPWVFRREQSMLTPKSS